MSVFPFKLNEYMIPRLHDMSTGSPDSILQFSIILLFSINLMCMSLDCGSCGNPRRYRDNMQATPRKAGTGMEPSTLNLNVTK